MGFDCLDCKDCGKHLNSFYNPGLSNTSKVPKCDEFSSKYFNCICDKKKDQCIYHEVNLFNK